LHSDPATFDLAAAHFDSVQTNVVTVIDRFHTLTGGGAAEFQGHAADAFSTVLGDLADHLRDVPAVAGQISLVFREHAAELCVLRTRADQALARALTAHSQRSADQGRYDGSASALTSIRRQLEAMRATSTPDDPQLRVLEDREGDAVQEVQSAQRQLSRSNDSVDASVREFHGFVADEDALDQRTADRLRHVDLHGLKNPGLLEKYVFRPLGALATGTLDSVVDFFSDLATMVTTLDFDEFLWRLHDVLKVVGAVLAIAAIFFPALAPLVLIVAVVTLGVSVALYVRGSTISETGERMSGWTVAGDAVSAVFAGVAMRLVGVGARGVLTQVREADGTFASPLIRGLSEVDDAHTAVENFHSGLERDQKYLESTELVQPYVPQVRIDLVPPPRSTVGPTKALLCPSY